jgi:hypothetical protein
MLINLKNNFTSYRCNIERERIIASVCMYVYYNRENNVYDELNYFFSNK